ncbi:hypothetical protein [Alicyclobacillus hesperidum]|uniref:hypothetical protein n=1 Tax=Alicyclobacillus hesperidum TaxID=89784 RepID=UPI0009430511|nr:hypothetical protein [Alicyclobacillus hesperidum]
MLTHHDIRKYIGQHVHCHTPFGTFQGIVVHLSKHHLILGSVRTPTSLVAYEQSEPFRQMPMGPGGPGSGWHFAIPLAAILGITAIGMHWW